VGDWGKLLGDTAAVSAMLGRLLHDGHVLTPVGRAAGARASMACAPPPERDGDHDAPHSRS
jgi:hypothetical protein